MSQTKEVKQQGAPWLGALARVAAVGVLLLACWMGSAQRDMWLDEAFTVQLLTDRSLLHMMHGLANAADGGMPLYYLLGYGWASLFGVGLLSLRLFSSLFVCIGVLLLWNTLRKAYSLLAVALSMAATTVTSGALLHQNVEARYYGFYFACAVLVFAAHFRLSQDAWPSRRLLAGAVVAHVALLMSHPFGLLYSAAAIIALLFSDYRRGTVRWRLYSALAGSWLALLAWIVPITRLHDVAVPHNWPPVPNFTDVLSLYSFASPCLAFGIIFGIGLTAFAPSAEEKQPSPTGALPLLACAVAYLVPPLLIALISLGDSSFFVDRYFIPSLIGVATLVASLFDARLRAVKLTPAFQVAWMLLFAALLIWPITRTHALHDEGFLFIDQHLPPDIPVIVTDAQVFLPLSYLSPKLSRPYYYPLDWDAAVHSSVWGASVDYKLMRNAKRSGYSSDRILEADQLRCSFSEFLVLDNPKYRWFQDRIVNNPGYVSRQLGTLPHDMQLWAITRSPGSASCAGK